MSTEPRFYIEHCKDNHRFYVVDRHTTNQMRWAGSFGEAEISRLLVQTICDALNAYKGEIPNT